MTNSAVREKLGKLSNDFLEGLNTMIIA